MGLSFVICSQAEAPVRVNAIVSLVILLVMVGVGFCRLVRSRDSVPAFRSPRNELLEFFRVWFTLGIVVYHILLEHDVQSELWIGVEFFFVVSGVFLLRVRTSPMPFGRFVLKRILKLYPLLLFGCLLCAVCYPVKSSFLMRDLTLRSGVVKQWAFNGPAWFVSVLMLATVVHGLLLRLPRRRVRTLTLLGVTLVSGVLAALNEFGYSGGYVAGISVRNFRGLFDVGVGLLVAAVFGVGTIHTEGPRWIRKLIGDVFCLCALALPFCRWIYMDWVWVAPVCLSLAVCHVLRSDVLLFAGLSKVRWSCLSRYTMAVFLTHCAVVYCIKAWQWQAVVWPVLPILALGVFAHFVIERPFRSLTERVDVALCGAVSKIKDKWRARNEKI